jgi:hypothetical protein
MKLVQVVVDNIIGYQFTTACPTDNRSPHTIKILINFTDIIYRF